MRVAEIYFKVKIYYSDLFGQYIVLAPKGNGLSSMHRFDDIEQAKEFIDKSTPIRWWEEN